MALLYADSFNLYNSVTVSNGVFSMADNFTGINNGSLVGTTNKTFNVTCSGSTPSVINIPFDPSGQIKSFCFGAQMSAGPNSAFYEWAGHYFSAINRNGGSGFGYTRNLSYVNTVEWQVGNLFIRNHEYVFFEIQVVKQAGNNTGFDIFQYINGVLRSTGSFTGFTNASDYWNSFQLSNGTSTRNGSTIRYDTIYLTDGERLGPITITDLLPAADTAQKDFLSTGANNYSQVNNPADLTGTYVYTTESGMNDRYTVPDFTLPAGQKVIGVTAGMVANVTGSTPDTTDMKFDLEMGGTTYSSPTATLASGQRRHFKTAFLPANPDTGLNFTADDINSIKLGPETL